jgi:transcriptional regulator with XRE-family HTH domain
MNRKVRALMVEKGIKQKEIADELGVQAPAISGVLNGVKQKDFSRGKATPTAHIHIVSVDKQNQPFQPSSDSYLQLQVEIHAARRELSMHATHGDVLQVLDELVDLGPATCFSIAERMALHWQIQQSRSDLRSPIRATPVDQSQHSPPARTLLQFWIESSLAPAKTVHKNQHSSVIRSSRLRKIDI